MKDAISAEGETKTSGVMLPTASAYYAPMPPMVPIDPAAPMGPPAYGPSENSPWPLSGQAATYWRPSYY